MMFRRSWQPWSQILGPDVLDQVLVERNQRDAHGEKRGPMTYWDPLQYEQKTSQESGGRRSHYASQHLEVVHVSAKVTSLATDGTFRSFICSKQKLYRVMWGPKLDAHGRLYGYMQLQKGCHNSKHLSTYNVCSCYTPNHQSTSDL